MWIVGRVSQALMTGIAMVIIVFVGLQFIGNPADILIPPDADLLERQRIIQQFGLDKSLVDQFFLFVKGVASGNFGVSYVYNEPAIKLIFDRLPATLELAFAALILSLIIGLPLGLFAGVKPRHPVSKFIMASSVLGFSLPTFWVGILLIMVFSVHLGWFPSYGRGQTVEFLGIHWSFLTWDGLKTMFLPALNLSLSNMAMVLRMTQAGTREAMGKEYVLYARAKGISRHRILMVHVMKNILIPVITVVGLDFGSLIAFSIVTESIYSWPGMGKLIIDSIIVLDRPVIVAYLFLVVILFVLINLVVDLAYTILDPRIRVRGRK